MYIYIHVIVKTQKNMNYKIQTINFSYEMENKIFHLEVFYSVILMNQLIWRSVWISMEPGEFQPNKGN